jgi:hypothetical protein
MVALELAVYARLAVRPRNGGNVFRYRLHWPGGNDLGEATYAMMIKLDEEIIANGNQRFRVMDVVRFEEDDESPFVGCQASRRLRREGGRDDRPLV